MIKKVAATTLASVLVLNTLSMPVTSINAATEHYHTAVQILQ